MRCIRLISYLFFSYCNISVLVAMDVSSLISAVNNKQDIALKAFSMLPLLPMPDSLRELLNRITVTQTEAKDEPAPQNFSTGVTKLSKIITITGKAEIKNTLVNVKIRVMSLADGSGQKVSVLLGLPAGFTFSSIDPKLTLINSLDLERAALCYSQTAYHDAEWGLDVGSGVNFLAVINTSGQVGELLKRLGKNMNQLGICGLITPQITGSRFSVGLGGGVTLGQGGKMGRADGLSLILSLIELAPGVPSLSVAVQAALTVAVSEQENPIQLKGEFRYTPPSQISLSGWMEKGSFYGPPAFGVKGFAIGEFGIVAGMDLAIASASGGVVPFTQFGLRGAIKFGRAYMGLGGQINYSTNPDLLMVGEGTKLYLQDLVSFGADIIDKAGTIIGKTAQLEAMVKDKLPEVGFKSVKVYVVPKSTTFMGVYYQKGIDVALVADIVGREVGCAVRVNDKGISGSSFVKGLAIGPVKIIAGPKAKAGTPPDQAVLLVTVDAEQLLARIYIDGGIAIDVMDGITGAATIDFSTEGIEAALIAKIFSNFEATVRVKGKGAVSPSGAAAHAKAVKGDLKNDANYSIYAKLSTDACTLLGNLLQKSAAEFMQNVKKVEEFRVKSQQDIQNVASKKADIQRQIDEARSQIKKLQDENLANINKAQEQLAPLQKKRDALDAAIARCKGQDPAHAQEMERIAQGKPLSQEEITARMKEVAVKYPSWTPEMRDMVRATLNFGAAPLSVSNGIALYPHQVAKNIPNAETKK